MPIVSHVILAVEFPDEAAQRVVEQWAEGLKTNAQRINAKRQARIPDSVKFLERMAGPSSKGYLSVLDPAFVSRAGLTKQAIVANQAANLNRSFEKYTSKLDRSFETVEGEPAKRFKDAVEARKGVYGKGTTARTLPFTGTRVEGRGVAPIAACWLTGDPKTEDLIRGTDQILEGGPYRVCPKSKLAWLKNMLASRLVLAGATILKGNYLPALITALNQTTNEMVQGFVDPALDLIPFVAAGDSKVDYILGENLQLYLEIKVSKM